MTQVLGSLADLASEADVFLVDQFGVLHDGITPYPGAIEALVRLKAAGKTVVLLSNSGKRARPNEERLLGLGFQPGSWDLFLTSGEVAWQRFSGKLDHPALPAKTRCLMIARDQDRGAIAGLDFQLVHFSEDAEIVLLSGSEGDRYPLVHYHDLLAPAVAAGAHCFCTNPDKVMLTSRGPKFGAGAIAELYEILGGKVTWIGKPFPEIYRVALRLLGNPDPARVIGIGDSLEHDIAGARAAGLSSALTRSGILADHSEAELEDLFEAHARPDFILPRFAWTDKPAEPAKSE